MNAVSRLDGHDIEDGSFDPGEEDFIIKKTTILSSDP